MIVLVSLLILAVIVGLGLFMVVQAFVLPAASLEHEQQRLTRSASEPVGGFASLAAERLGQFNNTAPDSDLELLSMSRSEWYRRRTLFGAVGGLFGVVIAIVLAIMISFSTVYVIGPFLALLFAALGVMVADSDRTTKAEAKRDEVRTALSQFLELTSIMLAGGAGAETAIEQASTQGTGPGFDRFVREVVRAREDPHLSTFAALRDLGVRLALPELVEFGNVMLLSSESAAAVSRALNDKAEYIVMREQEKRRSDAMSMNVLMSLPVLGMASGFIIWLIYAALAGLAGF